MEQVRIEEELWISTFLAVLEKNGNHVQAAIASADNAVDGFRKKFSDG